MSLKQSGGAEYDIFIIKATIKYNSHNFNLFTSRRRLLIGNTNLDTYGPHITLFTAHFIKNPLTAPSITANLPTILAYIDQIKNITFIPKKNYGGESVYSIRNKYSKHTRYLVRDFTMSTYDSTLFDTFLSNMTNLLRTITGIGFTSVFTKGFIFNGYVKIPLHMTPNNFMPHVTLFSTNDMSDTTAIVPAYKHLHGQPIKSLTDDDVYVSSTNIDDCGIIHRALKIVKHKQKNKYLPIILSTLQQNPKIEQYINLPLQNIYLLNDTEIEISLNFDNKKNHNRQLPIRFNTNPIMMLSTIHNVFR